MSRRPLLTLFRAAVLLPLLVASVVSGHASVLVCRFGAVMETACCPAEHHAAPADHASVRDEPCCALTSVDVARPVSDRQAEAVPVTSPAVARVAALEPATAPRAFVLRARRPPSVGPPLILLKRSFLI